MLKFLKESPCDSLLTGPVRVMQKEDPSYDTADYISAFGRPHSEAQPRAGKTIPTNNI